ncbi:MAG: putative sugar nucleotidyl transferase [Planctomycetota bacterium]|jgi:UDP-N-acetylglucosamine diphosphorylase/glucosamine-1-phosphate N-acetyltransferase
MSIVIVEDPLCSQLAPISYARMAFAIQCGSLRLVDLVGSLNAARFGKVRAHLQTLQRVDFPELPLLDLPASSAAEESPSLLLSARIAPTRKNLQSLHHLLSLADDPYRGTAIVVDRGCVVAVVRPTCTFGQLHSWNIDEIGNWLEGAATYTDISAEAPLTSFQAPHEVIATNMVAMSENLEWRIDRGLREGHLRQREDGVFAAENASLGPYTLLDTRKGPIVIDTGTQVGAYTLLRGPLYLGPNSKILEHSALKDHVTLGHTTKIGGEVEASIVEPFSNKQHHGFLGHSYLGSWINLGAGTCNSDLKNTYGTVNMEYPFGKSATNMQFLGCIMGDYSKTAINTGIFTGKVIGVCSMMYGFVTSNVPSYVNYARLFGQLASLPPEVMVSTQQRMFARRNVEQRGCDIQLIYDMHRLTQSERDGLGESLAG